MELKVKLLNFSAGRPVIILNKDFAKKYTIHVDSRVCLEKNSKKTIAVVDISDFLKENEAIISIEIARNLELKENDKINIKIARKPESVNLILEKLNGVELKKEEIKKIIQDIVDNALTEAEIAYFVSAVYKNDMTMNEIFFTIEAIVNSGKTLNLNKKPIVDKHSIGGIPGRITPIVVSICAAAGLIIPKTSSRAITTPSGTADAVETLCKVDLTVEELKKVVNKTNACLAWGGSLNLAPADDKIIQIERLINIDPEAQLLASIMSKKIAVGAKYVLIDIPYGKYAKVNFEKAKKLEKKFLQIAKHFKINLICDINRTEEPIGNGIGPALEIKDVIEVLSRKSPSHMLEKRSLELAALLLELTGKAKKGRGYDLAKNILDSKQAYKKFKEIVQAQNGNIPTRIREAAHKKNIVVEKNGKIKEINIKVISSIAKIAGCPMNKYAGIFLHKHLNEKVKRGENLITIYAETKEELQDAIEYYHKTKPIMIQ